MKDNDTMKDRAWLREKLTEVPQATKATTKCTIYRVYKHLRDLKPNAYEPEVIAIGPYHRDKDNLKMMEDHKLFYLHLLLQRKNEDVDIYFTAMQDLEQEVRNCYSEHISLVSPEFVAMLVLDGCFIVELAKYFDERFYEDDRIYCMAWLRASLRRDLMLFENQLPFFVLCKLFDLIEEPYQPGRLVDILSNFLKNLYPGEIESFPKDIKPDEIKHLLDLMHRCWCPPFLRLHTQAKTKNEFTIIDNATALSEANVKFQKLVDSKTSVFDIKFDKGAIQMPILQIEDPTESTFRNLIAYEQYFQDHQSDFVTDYIIFLDCLIDSSKDVEILSRNGVVSNWMGNNQVVADIVNRLGHSVLMRQNFTYVKLFKDVNQHCEKRCNRWRANLKRDYFKNPWTIISIIAAALLFLLTVVQTVFTVLQIL